MFESLANGKLGALGKIGNLNHSERFEVYQRKSLLQARAQIQKILKRQVGMESADDVKFRDSLAVSGGGRFKRLLQGHGVGAGRIFLAAEGAEAAGRDADICWIDVAVDVEIRFVTVHSLADVVGHPA